MSLGRGNQGGLSSPATKKLGDHMSPCGWSREQGLPPPFSWWSHPCPADTKPRWFLLHVHQDSRKSSFWE